MPRLGRLTASPLFYHTRAALRLLRLIRNCTDGNTHGSGSIPLLRLRNPFEYRGERIGHMGVFGTSDMVGRLRRTRGDLAAVENIQGWTRRRFKLPPDAPVLVSEVACTMPLCAPLQTAVAFWTADQRHQFKLYKPIAAVIYDDIGWLMGAPSDHGGTAWDCC